MRPPQLGQFWKYQKARRKAARRANSLFPVFEFKPVEGLACSVASFGLPVLPVGDYGPSKLVGARE